MTSYFGITRLIIGLLFFVCSTATQAIPLSSLFPGSTSDQSSVDQLIRSMSSSEQLELLNQWGNIDEADRDLIVTAIIDFHEGTARNIQLIYISTLGRLSDPEGLAYWVLRGEQSGSAYPIETLVPFITDSSEYVALLKNALISVIDLSTYNDVNSINNHIYTLSDAQQTSVFHTLLDQLYLNLFGRTTDTAGREYWLDQLKTRQVDLARLVETLINGATNQDHELLASKSAIGLHLIESMMQKGLITGNDLSALDSQADRNWSVGDALVSVKDLFSQYSSSNPNAMLNDVADLEKNLIYKLLPDYQDSARLAADDSGNIAYPMDFSANGNLLVVGLSTGFVKNVDLSGSGSSFTTQTSESRLHNNRVNAVQLTSDSSLLSGSADQSAILWSGRWTTSRSISAGATINALALNSAQTQLAIGTNTGQLSRWSYNSDNAATILLNQDAAIRAIKFIPDSNKLVFATSTGQIRIFDTTNNQNTLLGSMDGSIYDLAVTHNGTHLFAAGGDSEGGQITVWDLQTMTLIKTLEQHTSTTISLGLSADSSQLISGDRSGTIHLWNVSNRTLPGLSSQPLNTLEDLSGKRIHDLNFNPQQNYFAATDSSGRLTFWDSTNLDKLDSINLGSNITGGEENDFTTASRLSSLAFRSLVPLLQSEELLDQPNLYRNAFAINLDTATLSCPSAGTYQYTFTDANNDNLYQSTRDRFQVSTTQCQDASQASDGDYTLEITGNDQTQVDFNALTVTDSGSQTVFNGTVQFDIDEDANSRDTQIDATQIQVTPGNSGTFSYTLLDADIAEDLISNETQFSYQANLTVTDGIDQGSYQIIPLNDLRLTDFEDYPYTGKISIRSLSGVHQGITATLTVLDANQLLMEIDLDSNGIIEHSENVNWSTLSQSFR